MSGVAPGPSPVVPPSCLDEAVRLLRAGELVAFPTDTVYGVGAVVWMPGRWRASTKPSCGPLAKPSRSFWPMLPSCCRWQRARAGSPTPGSVLLARPPDAGVAPVAGFARRSHRWGPHCRSEGARSLPGAPPDPGRGHAPCHDQRQPLGPGQLRHSAGSGRPARRTPGVDPRRWPLPRRYCVHHR